MLTDASFNNGYQAYFQLVYSPHIASTGTVHILSGLGFQTSCLLELAPFLTKQSLFSHSSYSPHTTNSTHNIQTCLPNPNLILLTLLTLKLLSKDSLN